MTIAVDDRAELARDLLALTSDICARALAPRASEAEREATFPRDMFRLLGEAGLLNLSYAEEFGGAGLPAEMHLRVIEEVARAWATVAVGMSVHALSCLPVAAFGTREQQERLLPWMLSGQSLGAYCLSESHAGSDPAAMRTRARKVDGGYRISGAKAWTTHGGEADFYTVMARTSDDPRTGISCFFVAADSEGLSASPPERKLGLTASTTATMNFDDVFVEDRDLVGGEGNGLRIALQALDSGRLGIAAVATGLSRAALDESTRYARARHAFGQPIIRHEGVGFMLADMVATVETSRAMYLTAARRKAAGEGFTRDASVAKLVATDGAMNVTMNAVQVLGGAGYTTDFPVERYMREAKVMQIFEGTNQIQRLIIARDLERAAP